VTGYCFRSISLFLCLFLCQQDYEKTAGPICMKFSRKVQSDHGTTWFNFGSIPRNRAMPRCWFWPFFSSQHRGGVCCASHHSLFFGQWYSIGLVTFSRSNLTQVMCKQPWANCDCEATVCSGQLSLPLSAGLKMSSSLRLRVNA